MRNVPMGRPVEMEATTRAEARPVSAMRRVLGGRNFRLLWGGQGISLLGDQFFVIALPWLVLRLTGDPLALGLMVALVGIPRALFVLLGGAFTDRFSPRVIMIGSDLARMGLIGLLALIIASGMAQPWMLYLFAPVLGLLSGLFMPASNTIVPRIVDPADLQAGNALFQGTAQLSAFVGPTLAGAVIALGPMPAGGAVGATSAELGGIALAFGIDALTFLASITTLWMMRFPRVASQPESAPGTRGGAVGNTLAAIGAGFRYAWADPLLQTMIVIESAINFLVAGPISVGLPVLADTRLPERAAAYGIIMSAYGGGNLAGYVLAGTLPRWRRMGWLVIGLILAFGLGLALLGLATTTWMAFAVLLLLGVGNGYLGIVLITWLQQNAPQAMLGRVMSLILFASLSLIPLSAAVCGALLSWSLPGVFAGAGVGMLVAAAYAASRRELRAVEV